MGLLGASPSFGAARPPPHPTPCLSAACLPAFWRAQDLRGLLKIKYPLELGIITDWDDMERIWHHIYDEDLKTLSEEVSWAFRVLCACVGGRPCIAFRAGRN